VFWVSLRLFQHLWHFTLCRVAFLAAGWSASFTFFQIICERRIAWQAGDGGVRPYRK
jgi:hypothetical protein